MVKLGLIGYPLEHSFSQKYFEEKFRSLHIDGEYYIIPIKEFSKEIISKIIIGYQGISGLNVTSPWKRKIFEALDVVDDTASEIGSVNVVKIGYKGGSPFLKGYNSDWIGFKESLPERALDGEALIAGSGGAAASALYALHTLGIRTTVVSRNPGNAISAHHFINENSEIIKYEDVDPELMKKVSLIVNATPLGIGLHTQKAPPFPYHLIKPQCVCYDMNYNPPVTKFMELCKETGAIVMNGFEMLTRQAEISWNIWRN